MLDLSYNNVLGVAQNKLHFKKNINKYRGDNFNNIKITNNIRRHDRDYCFMELLIEVSGKGVVFVDLRNKYQQDYQRNNIGYILATEENISKMKQDQQVIGEIIKTWLSEYKEEIRYEENIDL